MTDQQNMTEWAPKLTSENIAQEYKKMWAQLCSPPNLYESFERARELEGFIAIQRPLETWMVDLKPVMPAGLDLGGLVDGLNYVLGQPPKIVTSLDRQLFGILRK